MTNKHTNKIMQQGSLMVEALALLGLITMVTPVMYKKAAERTTELQDINVATQMRTLTEALDNFVRNNYEAIKTEVPVDTPLIVKAKDDNNIAKGVKAYLPAGFDITQSKYFDAENLKFSIKREDITDISGNTKSVYTSAVLAPSLTPLQLNRAAKIASMIGINGGTIKGTKFEGTQGAWNADPMSWFNVNPATLKLGSLMSISSEVIAEGPKSESDTSKLLYRVDDGDSDKNTMRTNLLMGGKNIENINALFGSGGDLNIGSDSTNGNLLVNGLTTLKSTLKVESGGAEITGDVTLNNNASIGGTLKVTGATTLNSTLNVTGDTTLAKLTAGETTLESLAVTNDATIKHDLTVDNDATIKHDLTVDNDATIKHDLTVDNDATIKHDLTVDNDATIKHDLTVDNDATIKGSLISDKLHAKTRLTVGGDPEDPSVMTVDASTFNVKQGASSMNLQNSGLNVKASSTFFNVENNHIQALSTNDLGEVGIDIISDNTSGNHSMLYSEGGSLGTFVDSSNEYVYMKNKDNTGEIKIDDNAITLKKGASGSNMTMSSDSVNLKMNDKTRFSTDSNNTQVISPLVDKKQYQMILNTNSFSINNITYNEQGDTTDNKPSIGINESENFNVASSNVYIDVSGFAIGDNLTTSNGDRSASDTALPASNSQKVIISRKGYIELAPPANDGSSGNEAGFIRARRLVSDIPYYDNDDFNGNASESGKYDYYQVNPAYTSVMNDIKLASRGGARLSDILSDYVIKGIYVADNTYNAGYHKGAYTGYKADGSLLMDNDIDAEGLVWDMIPIENGSPEAGVIQSSDDEGATDCAEEGAGNCKIYSCTRPDCVASPWMGFVPRPQCPKNYLGVITNSPIRWRMSEVYHLTDNAKDWPVAEDEKPTNYNIIISDLDKYNNSSSPDNPTRFSKYFQKNTNPRKAIFSIDENNDLPDNPDKHTHNTTASPVTFQTNTWLNSSVSPHYVDNNIDGWHILMGFLYRPTDYQQLLGDMGYDGVDPEALHWNLFPVYANEMASIVTTYCAFAPSLTNHWNANSPDSPVLNYNQLNANTYRNPNSFDRNPVAGGTKGEGWEAQVNDPSLPYDDAW